MYNSIKETPLYLKSVIITNIIYYGFLIPSALIYPGYSPFRNTVSALGGVTKNPNGWFFFSIAMFAMAITILPFLFSMKRWYSKLPEAEKYLRLIIPIGLINSFALLMIGIFPTDTASGSTLHDFWSVIDFICIELIIVLTVVSLRNHPLYWNKLSIIAILDFVVCILYLVLYVFFRPVATIFEWLTFILILSYLLLLGVNMYKENV